MIPPKPNSFNLVYMALRFYNDLHSSEHPSRLRSNKMHTEAWREPLRLLPYTKAIGDFARSLIASSISAETIDRLRRVQCSLALQRVGKFDWSSFPTGGTYLALTYLNLSPLIETKKRVNGNEIYYNVLICGAAMAIFSTLCNI